LNFTRDEDLVGITEHKKQLIQWLAGDSEQRCKISTVWGMPGVGKTTLVAHVYKTIKMDFDAAAWVTVSQSYDVQELLKKIAGEFGIKADIANMEVVRLAETIYEYLQGKRYILVLDDIWTADVWSEIRTVFPSNCSGRFVITSRKHEVSLLGTDNSAIHLEPLDKVNSWELFCKSAFWNDGDRKCPLHLQVLASKFVQKCEGLPIAIACIGSQLSAKEQTSAEWEKAYDELELQLVKNVMPRVETIIKISLEDLPCDLKNCFLHCALFPEDYPIKRRAVTRHWISSGFIKKKGNQTLEEVAEEYLTELVNRSLLQVVKRNHTGRLKCCQMHDVIRLVALRKAEKECFGKVYDGSEEFSVGPTRRISIQSRNLDQISASNASHIRSLHVFERYINIDLLRPILTSSNLLSTLDLRGACIKMLPTEVFNLFNLLYLGLRYTAIESLPEAIGRLQNLEVLDAANAQLLYLPNNIVKLQKLRYLYACNVMHGGDIYPTSGVKVPSGIRHLTSLQALQCVEACSEILREVGDLTELRTFSACNLRSEHSDNLRDAVNKMSHLVHLEIITLGGKEVLQLEGLYLPPTFSWLCLQGQLEKKSIPQVLSSWSRLSSLTKLQMMFCKIDEESFSSLLVLRGLCNLSLVNAFDGKKLHFTAGCFPRLHLLSIWHAPQLNQVQIEQGAMSNLAELYFQVCHKLKFLPQGIEYLINLVELHLDDTSEELLERVQQNVEPNECMDDLMNISHIRKVIVRQSKKGIHERIERLPTGYC
jgi:disease resistance protein RPM1